MAWYLMDCGKPINGFQIKERYGAEFKRDKRHQNICRYVVFVVEGGYAGKETHTLRSAQKWCKEQESSHMRTESE